MLKCKAVKGIREYISYSTIVETCNPWLDSSVNTTPVPYLHKDQFNTLQTQLQGDKTLIKDYVLETP